MGLPRKALDAYLMKLNAHPLKMQLATGTMIGYAGDAIAQACFMDAHDYYSLRVMAHDS